MIKASELNPETLRRMGIKPKRNKYGVSPKENRTRDGIVFASKKEADFYDGLMLAYHTNQIKFFLRQVPFHLPGNIRYVADFMVFYNSGTWSVIDTKGFRTRDYINKAKQVKAIYGIEIREV